jgi:hypothetical protein
MGQLAVFRLEKWDNRGKKLPQTGITTPLHIVSIPSIEPISRGI